MQIFTKKTLLVTSLSLALVTGCASSTNTQKGAGIGAAVGALVGKGTGDNDKSRYVWGAALGAIAGTAIGSYMDKQEQEFEQELADTNVSVVREGDQLKLIMPGNFTFDTGSASISSAFYPVLDDVALILKKYDKTKLSIEGHTDSVGNSQFNQQLSENRANSVAGYLEQKSVESQRLRTLGMGETDPIASNDTEATRQQNRRVELNIIPVSDS
ncbi:OmpA family protein [Paraglaciecola sp. 2405UD69-4]|uniref:OmpA family protein n=1 Tax=Paraglaciecola sp. 2405UD69-4 TaxID=3391836 RepID=UPI0039C9079B